MGVSLGINLSKDTSKLEVCFGGFAPTAMNAGFALDEVVEESEARIRDYRIAREKAAAVEAARASEPCRFVDDAGVSWTYVVLDGKSIRIEKCENAVSTLVIPSAIAEKPVAAIASDACAYLPKITEVVCPDTVLAMGQCAFRGCKNLKKVKLPSLLTAYDSSWFRGCDKLEELQLPDCLPRLDSSLFDNVSLKLLHLGAGVCEIAPGAFGKSALVEVSVSEANPFLKTDGKAVYWHDFSVLVVLAVPVSEYRVAEGCKLIARKAFSGFSCVEQVHLPRTLEHIEGFAFWRTSVSSFMAPQSLRVIEEKSFFNCRKLNFVTFEEGLVTIGENAFTGTAIEKLYLPSTVEELGNPLAAGTKLSYAGPEATFKIAAGGEVLFLDEAGGLYRKDGDRLWFELLLDPHAVSYAVRDGVAGVGRRAFAGHQKLKEVVLPEGLEEIADEAFKDCGCLTQISIPESVRRIGNEAFLDTSLEQLYLPDGVEHLGKNALITKGAHFSMSMRQARVSPSLRRLEVGANNKRFFMQGSLLLERAGTDGSLRVLLCTGSEDIVRIPPEVNEIAQYALNNVKGIRELYLSDRIVLVGIRGLAIDGFVELIHVDLVKKHEGRDFFEFRFPETDRGIQQMMLALSVPDHVNVEVLFGHYDTAITNGSSFDAATEKGLDIYDQATRLIRRLQDPVYLSVVNRQLCERFLSNNVEAICLALAKRDDRASIDAMLDLGFLNADNIYAVVERVGALQDATMTNYLLEARRLRFEQSVFDDFDL